MRYIDLHCDTLMLHMKRDIVGDLGASPMGSVDFDRMKEGGVSAQFFAIFLMAEEEYSAENIEFVDFDDYILRASNYLHENIKKYNEIIEFAGSYKDMKNNEEKNKMSAFITIEDGKSVNGDMKKLKHYFDLGIRLITLTWNYENCFGFPNSENNNLMQLGLKPFGKEAIQYMEELGIIVDVSHLSDGGFFDVAKIMKKPFLASHSNARAITNHPRNLTDEMIRILADKGGVCGLNFCPIFLNEDNRNAHNKWVDNSVSDKIARSRIEDMVIHLNHMKKKGGEDFVVLGSDFDGISGELEISSSNNMYLLFDRLEKSGWSLTQVEKLAYKNIERFIKDVI